MMIQQANASFVGRMGGDPELAYSDTGQPRINFSVGVNGRSIKNKDGTWDNHTFWVRCVHFGQRSETIAKELKKGWRVAVSGEITRITAYTNREGVAMPSVDMNVSGITWDTPKDEQPEGESTPSYSKKPAARSPIDPDDIPF